jgi:hypothetical protein
LSGELERRPAALAAYMPGIVFQEHLLLRLVLAAARALVRDRWFETEHAHLQDKLLEKARIRQHEREYSVKLARREHFVWKVLEPCDTLIFPAMR